jgi:hypothetical protein
MNAMRMTMLTIASIMVLGIWLTGFDKVHWVLYLPPIFLVFAGVTGICPSLIIWSKLGFKNEAMSCDLPGTKTKH